MSAFRASRVEISRAIRRFAKGHLFLPALLMALPVSAPLALCGEEPLPEAPVLLEAVREALPLAPLRFTGQLQAQGADGEIERTWNLQTRLTLGATPPRAEYTVQDAFGTPLYRLVLSWPAPGAPRFEYFAGADLAPAPLPDVYTPLPGMDFSWADLSLFFLWWPDGRTVGTDSRRGRRCYVLDLKAPPAPQDHASQGVFLSAEPVYSGVRLWIDAEVHVLLQADAYGPENRLARRLQVKSFKRVNDLWTILDLEIQRFPSRHKTVLRVRDVVEEQGNAHR